MNYTPFGFKYEGETCTIKLRFNKQSFDQANIKEYGNYRYTTSGHIIFETKLNVTEDKFVELSQRLKALKTTTK